MKNRQRRITIYSMIFIAPWALGFLAFTIYPIAMSLYYSLTAYTLGSSPQWIGLANWNAMFHDPLFWTALRNTLYYAGGTVPLQLVVALAIAVLLNANIFGRGIFRTIFYLPTVVPTVATSILWIALFNPFGGIINHALGLMHLPQPLWLQSPAWAMPALILMSAWSVGSTIVIFLAGLQDVPRYLYEQATIDGARGWQIFRNVTLPMISPIILFNLILGIIGSMQTFTQPFLMTAGGPVNSTLLFSLYVFRNAFQYLNMGYASTLAWFLFMVMFGLTLLVLRLTRKSVFYR